MRRAYQGNYLRSSNSFPLDRWKSRHHLISHLSSGYTYSVFYFVRLSSIQGLCNIHRRRERRGFSAPSQSPPFSLFLEPFFTLLLPLPPPPQSMYHAQKEFKLDTHRSQKLPAFPENDVSHLGPQRKLALLLQDAAALPADID